MTKVTNYEVRRAGQVLATVVEVEGGGVTLFYLDIEEATEFADMAELRRALETFGIYDANVVEVESVDPPDRER